MSLKKIDPKERIEINAELADLIRDTVREEFQNLLAPSGIRVLSLKEAAEYLGVTTRHLRRMEKRGKIPRRRQLTERRVVYYEHELRGEPPPRGRRVLNQTMLADKLGISLPTLAKLRDELPPTSPEGGYYENQIDSWLLRRPPA